MDGLPTPQRHWAMMAVAIAIIMAVLDGTLINLALPLMAHDLGASPSLVVWVVSSYQLVITVSLFPFSALGDRIGYRAVFIGGMLLFTSASLACALAPSVFSLIGARVVQGLGASALMSVNIALIRYIFPKHALGRGIGYNTLIVALSASAGPSLSAAILSIAPWPWLFGINVPLGIAALIIAVLSLPRTPIRIQSFDLSGSILSAVAIGSLVITADGLDRRSENHLYAALQILVVCGLLLWLYRDQSRKAHPAIPIDILRIPSVGLSALTSTLCYVVQSLSYVGLPFLFHSVIGFSVPEAGLLMTAWPLALALISPVSGRLSDRYSAGLLGTLGLTLLSLGLALLIFMPHQPAVADVFWRMGVCGLGFGLFQAPNSKAIVAGSPLHRTGAASALQSAARLLGQTLGAALVAALLTQDLGEASAELLAIALGFSLVGCAASFLRTILKDKEGAT
ncbi:MFS transporter [Microvirga puerhi]|uniref:MFS transporter n=1 Tax=Microvirga puerhi TaxID=2876078 RepID=A0ABS7VJV2_9HYPH|nr:MFS transporter [Microvirga puerhi]MBZ6075764.1 MFS transporter [Microvirga puerhi]